MFLQPKKNKYKKIQKKRLQKLKFKSSSLIMGSIGLKAAESGTVSARHIETARQAITRKLKRKGKLWLRIYPSLPITSKPAESRMGKGKGSVKYWSVKVIKGTILFELYGIDYSNASAAFKTGGAKLPIKTLICI